jgi:peptide deformylase
MNKDDIIALPNTHLRERSKKVGVVNDERIKNVIEGMKNATLDWEASREHEVGVALAAIQIDVPLRIIVVRKDFNDRNNHEFTVFINPVITKYEGELVEDFEGCLSVPDVYGKVPRYSKVRVKALDENGKEVRVTADGFLARIFQHEVDHTNGMVFIDRIKESPGAFYHLLDNGHLKKLDYEKDIKNSSILW